MLESTRNNEEPSDGGQITSNGCFEYCPGHQASAARESELTAIEGVEGCSQRVVAIDGGRGGMRDQRRDGQSRGDSELLHGKRVHESVLPGRWAGLLRGTPPRRHHTGNEFSAPLEIVVSRA